jgi:hypothetical protein
VTASEDTVTGRALIEAGNPVAGSMSRAAATVVFQPSAAAVQVDDRFAACLRTVAADAADLPIGRERVRAGAALPRLRAADLRLTRRGVLLHRLLVLDLLHDDAVTAALSDLGLPRT